MSKWKDIGNYGSESGRRWAAIPSVVERDWQAVEVNCGKGKVFSTLEHAQELFSEVT